MTSEEEEDLTSEEQGETPAVTYLITVALYYFTQSLDEITFRRSDKFKNCIIPLSIKVKHANIRFDIHMLSTKVDM